MGKRHGICGSDLQLKTVLQNAIVPEIHNPRNVDGNERVLGRKRLHPLKRGGMACKLAHNVLLPTVVDLLNNGPVFPTEIEPFDRP